MKNEGEKQVLFEGRHLNFVRRGRWEYVERRNVTGIVGIVAVTEDGKLVLVEQHRPPVAGTSVELPAGLAGDAPAQSDEALETAARRELFEETGYEAAEMTWLGHGAPSAGISDEVITFYLAEGLRKAGCGGGDDSEKIVVHEVPIAEVDAWLRRRQQEGACIDLKVYAGMYLFLNRPGRLG